MDEFKSIMEAGNGKGDAPRNVSATFRDNYDLIDWGHEKPPANSGEQTNTKGTK